MEFIPEELQQYAERYTSGESPVLKELDRETNLKVLYPRMLSGHLQGRFLAMISRIKRPETILEIGTYTGYSAICLAEGLAEGGRLVTIEIEPEREPMIRKYLEKAGIAGRVELIIGDAHAVVPELEGPFDLAFLDADKAGYTTYYEAILPKMPAGGVILADNMLWSGRVLDPAADDKETRGLRSFVKRVAEDDRVEQVLLPIRDGILMIEKK